MLPTDLSEFSQYHFLYSLAMSGDDGKTPEHLAGWVEKQRVLRHICRGVETIVA